MPRIDPARRAREANRSHSSSYGEDFRMVDDLRNPADGNPCGGCRARFPVELTGGCVTRRRLTRLGGVGGGRNENSRDSESNDEAVPVHGRSGLWVSEFSRVHFSRTPTRINRPAPLLGEHTRELLRDHGYTDTEIADFIADGVVATTAESAQA